MGMRRLPSASAIHSSSPFVAPSAAPSSGHPTDSSGTASSSSSPDAAPPATDRSPWWCSRYGSCRVSDAASDAADPGSGKTAGAAGGKRRGSGSAAASAPSTCERGRRRAGAASPAPRRRPRTDSVGGSDDRLARCVSSQPRTACVYSRAPRRRASCPTSAAHRSRSPHTNSSAALAASTTGTTQPYPPSRRTPAHSGGSPSKKARLSSPCVHRGGGRGRRNGFSPFRVVLTAEPLLLPPLQERASCASTKGEGGVRQEDETEVSSSLAALLLLPLPPPLAAVRVFRILLLDLCSPPKKAWVCVTTHRGSGAPSDGERVLARMVSVVADWGILMLKLHCFPLLFPLAFALIFVYEAVPNEVQIL
eukprot:Rhum_TRINITY_DN6889_c0_g1::Rhum_TRINITY_DN6889_c0_g1_i1::g.21020::m.21020